VTLFATADSVTKARLISPWPVSLWRAKVTSPHAVWSLHLSNLLDTHEEFDIIHDHCTFYTAPFTRFLKPPVVSTLHRPLTPETHKVFGRYPKTHYVPISRDQQSSAELLAGTRYIYNGIPTERFPFNASPSDYLLWLSKITPEKGVVDAIKTAKMSGLRLIIAGNVVGEEGERFFKYEVSPLIDGERVEYVGQADFETKVKLYRGARALLCPFHRREPFGLVMTEAMACGTPVIGYRVGSIPEIVEDGVTGFVVDGIEGAVEAVGKIPTIDRQACRRRVEEKFSTRRMVDDYESLFSRTISSRP
jgi:glycosyltransferase involved in cell wall biosynthesis